MQAVVDLGSCNSSTKKIEILSQPEASPAAAAGTSVVGTKCADESERQSFHKKYDSSTHQIQTLYLVFIQPDM